MSNYFEKKMELREYMKDMDKLSELIHFLYKVDVMGVQTPPEEEKKKFSYISLYLTSKYKTESSMEIHEKIIEKAGTLKTQIDLIEKSFEN